MLIAETLADLYQRQGRDEQARPLYERALHIREQVLGPAHPGVAELLGTLANLSLKPRKVHEAEMFASERSAQKP